jgi:hypothetical protein
VADDNEPDEEGEDATMDGALHTVDGAFVASGWCIWTAHRGNVS